MFFFCVFMEVVHPFLGIELRDCMTVINPPVTRAATFPASFARVLKAEGNVYVAYSYLLTVLYAQH